MISPTPHRQKLRIIAPKRILMTRLWDAFLRDFSMAKKKLFQYKPNYIPASAITANKALEEDEN
jgi:hypothetical protein